MTKRYPEKIFTIIEQLTSKSMSWKKIRETVFSQTGYLIEETREAFQEVTHR